MPSLLAFRPRPERGELFTSWLARLALDNGTTIAQLIASCTPDTHYLSLDLDLHLPRSLLHRLADRTGLPWTVIERATLRELHDLYVGRRRDHGAYRWFMPVHPVRRRFTMYGQQVCPDCLASDVVPYYRQFWRLSFVTTCPVHECMLLDRCPACGAPVDHRGACDGRLSLVDEAALCRCAGCGADFRWFAWQFVEPGVTLQDRRDAWGYAEAGPGERKRRIPQETTLRTAVRWQARLTTELQDRSVPLGGTLVPIDAYLGGCRHLLRLLASDERSETFSRLVALQSGRARHPVTIRGRLRFDRSDVTVRHANLSTLSWLLSDWPTTFQVVCLESGVSYTALTRPGAVADLPDWYGRQCLTVRAVRAVLSSRA